MPAPETSQAQALIPGAYERNALTHRQVGSMGGSPFGTTDVPIGPNTLGAATIGDRELEGGGAVSERRPRRVNPPPQAAQPFASAQNTSRFIGVKSWFLHWSRLVPR